MPALNHSVRRALLRTTVAAGCLVLVGAATAAAQPDAALAPSPEAIVKTLFRERLISSFFAPQIREIALHYARRTTFAGNVRINDSPDRRALNVYVFHYRDSLPRFLRNTCNSFPADRLVVCDHRFLDSMPATPPIALESTDRLPAPALMYWALGHEIGHIVLQHDRSAFLAFGAAPGRAPSTPAAGADRRTPDIADIRLLNRFEVDADRFAISSLPLTAGDQWLHFGNPLLDALWWERSRVIKAAGGTENLSPTDSASVKQTIRIRVADGLHPPMILRLEDLLTTIRSTYTNFPYPEGWVGRVEYVLERVAVDQLVTGGEPEAGLFYGAVYLGSDFAFAHGREVLADRAMLVSLLGMSPYADLLRDAECADNVRLAAAGLDWPRRFLCRSWPSASEGESLLKYVDGCKSRLKEEALRCYGTIPLIGIACQRHVIDPKPPWCNAERLRTLDRQYAGHEFGDGGREELLEWTVAARYLFEIGQAAPDADLLDGWTIRMSGLLIAKRGSSVGWDLVERHARYLQGADVKDGWQRSFRLSQAASEFASDAGNDDRAVMYARRMVAIADAHAAAEDPIHGYVRRVLAGLLRHYGVHRYGSSEGIGFLTTREFAAARAAWEAIRAEAGPMAESAAAAYRRSLDAARRQGAGEAVPVLHEGYLNALGDVVYSHNVLAKTEPALRFAKTLRAELDAAAALRTRSGFETRVLAPALENMATAYLAAPEGDASLAVAQAREALAIREKQEAGSPIVSLRVLAFSLYAVGDHVAARRIATRYVETFEKTYGRRIAAPDGAIVRGTVIEMAAVLANRPKG